MILQRFSHGTHVFSLCIGDIQHCNLDGRKPRGQCAGAHDPDESTHTTGRSECIRVGCTLEAGAQGAARAVKGDNHDQQIGVNILVRALEEPIRQIVANAGDEPSVVVNKVNEGTGNYGYNAQTSEYGDMIAMGILDPTKVARSALQNASSVAGLILTTECMVAEAPKKDAQGHAPAGNGGMGGMGGMEGMGMM